MDSIGRSPLTQIGLPLAIGIGSAASPAGARGARGLIQSLSLVQNQRLLEEESRRRKQATTEFQRLADVLELSPSAQAAPAQAAPVRLAGPLVPGGRPGVVGAGTGQPTPSASPAAGIPPVALQALTLQAQRDPFAASGNLARLAAAQRGNFAFRTDPTTGETSVFNARTGQLIRRIPASDIPTPTTGPTLPVGRPGEPVRLPTQAEAARGGLLPGERRTIPEGRRGTLTVVGQERPPEGFVPVRFAGGKTTFVPQEVADLDQEVKASLVDLRRTAIDINRQKGDLSSTQLLTLSDRLLALAGNIELMGAMAGLPPEARKALAGDMILGAVFAIQQARKKAGVTAEQIPKPPPDIKKKPEEAVGFFRRAANALRNLGLSRTDQGVEGDLGNLSDEELARRALDQNDRRAAEELKRRGKF